jgi:hypothetical protein
MKAISAPRTGVEPNDIEPCSADFITPHTHPRVGRYSITIWPEMYSDFYELLCLLCRQRHVASAGDDNKSKGSKAPYIRYDLVIAAYLPFPFSLVFLSGLQS